MPLSTGQILNQRYRIVNLLGQGGFGAVYRAWDMNLKRAFALKENLDLSPESVRQFEREASFLADLHHPNLPRVIDCFVISDQGQYLVMDFIEGKTIEEMMNQAGGRLPESQVLQWIEQVCEALTYLHNQKPPVIHRDIKPANIKITPEGKAVLVDFGIAKAYFGQMQTTLGARAVTEGYSPPEQYGHGITDARSDLYALGATMYHMLTGIAPVESVQRHLETDLLAPRKANPSISPQTEEVIMKAMDIDMDGRFQTADRFRESILSPVSVLPKRGGEIYSSEVLEDTLIAIPREKIIPQEFTRKKQTVKSRRGIIIGVVVGVVICALVLVLGALGGVFTFLKGTPTATPTITIEVPTELPTNTEEFTLTPEVELTLTPSPVPPTPSWTPSITLSPTEFPPTRTPSWTPTLVSGFWQPCHNTYPSRLHVDDKAYVSFSPPFRNRVRSSPTLSASEVGYLEPGEKMKIFNGPACADSMVWWEVRSLETSVTGWTSEGDIEDYWLVPME